MIEADWMRRVIDTARLYGWRVAHHRPARTKDGWRTPIQGDPGVPDLLLARNGVVLLAELKRDGRSQYRPGQREWLTELGPHGRLWVPDEWDQVLKELSS